MFLNRVITITGAASGIGLAAATLLASRGALISIADINRSNLEAAAQAIRSSAGGSVKILSTHLDIRKPLSVDA
jgi:NAD(P)-dependent dehydrogenase (short-subunit alcohol dehydrogenase family)